jgi:hypothetical protein
MQKHYSAPEKSEGGPSRSWWLIYEAYFNFARIFFWFATMVFKVD